MNSDSQFRVVYDEIMQKAEQAFDKAMPVPMIVGTAKSLFDNEIDYSKPTEFVSDGVCGFAWVKIKPARGPFVSWLKKNKIGRSGTYGGWEISPKGKAGYSQSMQRKEAYCSAMAYEFEEKLGINCWVESRMD